VNARNIKEDIRMDTIHYASISRGAIKNDAYDALRQFVDVTADLMRLEAMQALAGVKDPAAFPVKLGTITAGGDTKFGGAKKQYRSVGTVVTERIASKKVRQRAQILGQVTRPHVYTPATKSLARKLNVSFKSNKYVLEQVKLGDYYSFVNESYAATLLTSVLDLLRQQSVDGGTAVLNTGVRFRLHRVKCLDPTNGEWGNDEIALGGTYSDDAGNVGKIPQFRVGSFHDGHQKTYDPPKVLVTFALTGAYPKTFVVYVAMAEKDEGGFGDFIADLYDAVKAEVVNILTVVGAAAGAEIGAAIGASSGTAVAGPVGTAIGIIVGLIVGALIGWITSALRDDIFEPELTTLTLPSATAAFAFVGDSLISPEMDLVYEELGGLYKAWYSWEIVQ
jgi:hypothetical protein